eukprot:gnl/TRDRNA2_/TRDRNA2_159233_c0_seq1.p1 gnl/TRDRNA2_/TRDRNA2_159233_c0~~gnl/TRDRNA2_/TRDRNA2_159233_c0_seq1.p1  ORF type:complete len:432 (+),score=72.17 gnl/TRDRNA2_/TRDRNA2_159233_c0_seq1:1-1296(+)
MHVMQPLPVDAAYQVTFNIDAGLEREGRIEQLKSWLLELGTREDCKGGAYRVSLRSHRGSPSNTLQKKHGCKLKLLSSSTYNATAVAMLKAAVSLGKAEWIAATHELGCSNLNRGHFPGGGVLEGDKGLIFRELHMFKTAQLNNADCMIPDAVPLTFDLFSPENISSFCAFAATEGQAKNTKWIIKPKKGAQGYGHKRIDTARKDQAACIADLPDGVERVAQHFLDDILKVNDSNVELRFYVLLASAQPFLALYHPDLVVKQAGRGNDDTQINEYASEQKSSWIMNVHAQKIHAVRLKELEDTVGGPNALAKLHRDLKRLAWLAIQAHRQQGGFTKARQGDWELYGLDAAITSSIRPYLIDWNAQPGCSLHIIGGAEIAGPMLRDMYQVALALQNGATGAELAAAVRATPWQPIVDDADASFDPASSFLCG